MLLLVARALLLRAVLAGVAGLLLTIVLGPPCIRWLRRHAREPIKSASAEVARLHATKRATPTMGGLLVLAAVVTSTLICGDWHNSYLHVGLLVAIGLGAVGACDDLVKISTAARGLRARTKLMAQSAIGLLAGWLLYRLHAAHDGGLDLVLPLVGVRWQLGWLFVPWTALVIVGFSNAVNLTDGLDGLAGGCLICATGAMALVVYAAGDAEWAWRLAMPHVDGGGEMTIVAAGMLGALCGFLWFNCHPASVFMGDTGSLPLGGLLGLLALTARQEWLLVVVGGVFVVEAASVVMQVAWFRCRRRRLFLCAPVHHHFQLAGWPEDKIVVRFWIAAAVCAAVGLAGLSRPGRSLDAPFGNSQLPGTHRVTTSLGEFPR